MAIFLRSTLLTFALGLSACSQVTFAQALAHIIVQLSWFHPAEFAGFYAAAQLGYCAEERLQVSFVEGGPTVDFITPVTTGTAQFGVAQPADLILARAAGKPVHMIVKARQVKIYRYQHRGTNG